MAFMIRRLKKELGNLPGWRTSRKLIVFESDDWGSIRMPSKRVYNDLLATGLRVDRDRYNSFDALECNRDMEMLLEVLDGHRDGEGNAPVFTAVTIVANPDFDRIRDDGFASYHFEPFTDTLRRYPEHNRVFDLIQEGIKRGLYHPEFHGREHLNVSRWMRELRDGNKPTKTAFDHGLTGISAKVDPEVKYTYQAAFDLDSIEELEGQGNIITEGLGVFESLFGYRARFFVPPNYFFNNQHNMLLSKLGIDLLNTGKVSAEPVGEGRFKRSYRYIGKRTGHGDQIYMTRNCQFEPNDPTHVDWVDKCLADIQSAFRWNKPAVISTHRINFMGFLRPENRERGLRQLDQLIRQIRISWPESEFVTTRDLGQLILAG